MYFVICIVDVCLAHGVVPSLNGRGGAMDVKHGDVCVLMVIISGGGLVRESSGVWVTLKCLESSPDEVSGGGLFGFRERKVRAAREERRSGFGTGWMDLDSVHAR